MQVREDAALTKRVPRDKGKLTGARPPCGRDTFTKPPRIDGAAQGFKDEM
jgi:hypothetical protein